MKKLPKSILAGILLLIIFFAEAEKAKALSEKKASFDALMVAGKAVEATFEAITGALKSGGEVRLVGFGTFGVAKRKASTGRNPRTGEPMTIKASTQPKFKAGKALKDAIN